jgi:hypothetical protein
MPEQENIQLIRDLFHAMDAPGPESEDAMMKMLDESISWHAVPWDRTLSGRDEVLAVVRKTWESAPSHPFTHIFADNEWVCLECVLEGTKKAAREYIDRLTIFTQLGVDE